MDRILIRFALAALAALVTSEALAQQTSPEEVVRSAVEGVMNSVKADAAAKEGDAARITVLVEQKFLPFTDFLRTTQLAVGATWKSATPDQQKMIFEQFQALLVHTYALELTQVSDQNLKFQYGPAASGPPGTDVIVKTHMITSADDSEIDYRLEKTPAGWKIYDINILGAWLSNLYRNQFSGQLSKGGPDALIKALREHNGREAS